VIASVLDQLQLIDARCRADLADWFEPAIQNYRGIVVGRILSAIVLDKTPVPIGRREAGPQ